MTLSARSCLRSRGVALISVLLSTVLLLALVAVLVDIGTLRLQRTTADLFSLQALAGADGGTAWVRALLDQEHGDVSATQTKLGETQGKRRFTIDDHTYVVATEELISTANGSDNHVDYNVQTNSRAQEYVVQVESSAAVYTNGAVMARRDTGVLLRVYAAAPYSEVVGYVDDSSAVGINSPGDAAGQEHALDTTDLLVHVYQIGNSLLTLQSEDQFEKHTWSDGNSSGSGPLP